MDAKTQLLREILVEFQSEIQKRVEENSRYVDLVRRSEIYGFSVAEPITREHPTLVVAFKFADKIRRLLNEGQSNE